MIRKNLILNIAVLASLLFISAAFIQDSTKEKIQIKTSSVCNMCKTTIENGIKAQEGIEKAKLDLSTKIVTVSYNPALITPEEIRTAISLTGYDADSMRADSIAYSKLHHCCKLDHKH